MPGRSLGPARALAAGLALLLLLLLLLPSFAEACDDPPRSQSMMISGTAKPTYAPGDRVDYTCRPGYKSVPGLFTHVVCQNDNTWTPLQEACTRKKCPTLADPSNGRVDYVNGSAEFGSQAHVSCEEGFRTIGTKILHCELAGNDVAWSDTVPNCIKVECAKPAQIPNGRFTNSHKDTFEYSEVVTYSCDPSNGPDPYSLVGQRQLICSASGNWSAEPPECKVVKCPYPVVYNGRPTRAIGKKFYYESIVQFACLDGFYLSGNSTVSCRADSTWQPPLPTCIKVPDATSTEPPPGPPGVHTLSSGSSPTKTSETIGVGLISLIVLNVWRQRPLQTFPRTQLPPEKTLPSEGPLTRASVSLDPGKAVTTQSASRRHSPRNKAGS
ncbi:membrane cofactor protein-like isoform X2 [Erinaceus europaeus]|uniref:Membrane cofactor protein n=1 Tax=Erinaceus europaeus TaxID=9365 RepID=A0ABM3WCP4_ERIEU|nr:membrane cofactor protein-like isoform X2 [Erinaceus europaeus]